MDTCSWSARKPPKGFLHDTLPSLSSAGVHMENLGARSRRPWKRPIERVSNSKGEIEKKKTCTSATIGAFHPVAPTALPPCSSSRAGTSYTARNAVRSMAETSSMGFSMTRASSSTAGVGFHSARSTTVGFYSTLRSEFGPCAGGALGFGSVSLETPVPTKADTLSLPQVKPQRVSDGLPTCIPMLNFTKQEDEASLAHHRSADYDSRLVKATVCSPHVLHLADLARSGTLRAEFKDYQLKDYFDTKGAPRFKRMGLTFAATQTPEKSHGFGSRIEEDPLREKKRPFNPRAHANMHATLVNDIEYGEQQRLKILDQIMEDDRFKGDEVCQRQLDWLFFEIPDFMKYLPPGIDLNDLRPMHVDRMDEINAKQSCDRTNARLSDKRWVDGRKMHWMMNRDEVLHILRIAMLWTRAAWNKNCPLGMDRPSYCRFIIECGMVDQRLVPFHWAASLFDSMAQNLQCCPIDALWASSAPVTPVANLWALASIFDVLLRQQFNSFTKHEFFKKLDKIAERRLPFHLHSCIKKTVDNGSKTRKGMRSANPSRRQSAVSVSSHWMGDESDESPTHKHDPTKAGDDAKKQFWMIPPERPATAIDTIFEGQVRDRLITSMLFEPEVLHLAMQYQEIFQTLHECYCDEAGHMNFNMFFKFCIDFHLSPNLVSTDFLLTTYKKAVNCEEGDDMPLSVSPSPSGSARSSFGDVTPTSRVSLAPPSVASVVETLVAGRKGKSVKDTLSPHLAMSAKVQAVQRFMVSKPSARSKSPSATGIRKNSNMPPGSSGEKLLLPFGVDQPIPRKFPIFGVGAFLETLFKISFVRLGCYGNAPQQCTGGYARVVWLLTYFQCVYEHIYNCWKKSGGIDNDDARWHDHRQLCDALKKLPPASWTQVSTALTISIGQQVVQPLPGVGVGIGGSKTHGKPPRVTLHGEKMRPTLLPRRDSVKPEPEVEGVTSPPSFPASAPSQAMGPSPEAVVESRPASGTQSYCADMVESGSSSDEDEAGTTKNGSSMPAVPKVQDIPSPVEKGRKASFEALNGSRARARTDSLDQWCMEELFEVEGGRPAVIDGSCKICARKLAAEHWGNPRCRGCSIVDAIEFRHHPFNRLLNDAGGARLGRLEAELPRFANGCLARPPPVGDLEQHLSRRQSIWSGGHGPMVDNATRRQ